MLLFLLKKKANPNEEGRACFAGVPGLPLHTAMVSTQIDFMVYGPSADAGRSDQQIDHAAYARLVLETLVEAGAYVGGRSKDGKTPLHVAAKLNNLFGAELLLKAGSTVMPRDDAGKTPLDYAESADMIKLLKAHGATER